MGNFKIGEKVVCIGFFKYDKHDLRIGNKLPIKGEIYTIREIDIVENGYLRFKEINNPNSLYLDTNNVPVNGEICFNPSKFRKLDYEFSENLLAEISEAMKSETIKN